MMAPDKASLGLQEILQLNHISRKASRALFCCENPRIRPHAFFTGGWRKPYGAVRNNFRGTL